MNKLMVNSEFDLDQFLFKLGRYGRFQITNYVLLSFAVMATSAFTITFIFTTGNPRYRCYIPECDFGDDVNYNPQWLKNAVPFKENLPRRCEKYVHIYNESHQLDRCTEPAFDSNQIVKCDEFIFENNRKTIAHDFNLYCEENLWKLTLPGTINNIGQLIGMPLTGLFSDRFGRRNTIVISLLLCATFGIARSFASTYMWFNVFEFFDQCAGAGIFGAAFLLVTEFLEPKERVFGGIVLGVSFSIGEAVMGIFAWYFHSWRTFLQAMYGPALLFIFYFWIVFESPRWLIAKGRFEETETILKNVLKINRLELSNEEVHNLMTSKTSIQKTPCGDIPKSNEWKQLFKNPRMMLRVLVCSICVMICTFVFYGMSLNSVSIGGNMYTNFIFICLAEIPANIITVFALDKFGRKYCLSASFLWASACCLAFIFISEDVGSFKGVFFLLGKSAITVSFATLYIYNSELFPTSLRHSLLGICGMFGRIGSTIAPQTPLLGIIWSSLPLLLFSGVSFCAGILALALPETRNIPLPDTIAEASKIGQRRDKPVL